MIDPQSLWGRVGLADIRGHHAFFRSLRYWHQSAPPGDSSWLSTLKEVGPPLRLDDEDQIVEVANCRADINLSPKSALHIYGDLEGKVTAPNHSEVVVAGNVLRSGSIQGDGIIKLFVAGDCDGAVRNPGSTFMWLEGDFRGEIFPGHPSTQIHIGGDFHGSVIPVEKGPLLYLYVEGFASYESLQAIGEARFAEFAAVVGRSNKPAGFYPDEVAREALEKEKSHNRWIVLGQ